MARKRMISPEFFTSKTLNGLPVQTMVTFAGLWCYVDDQGRGEDDVGDDQGRGVAAPPHRHRVEDRDRPAALDQAFLICRYAVAGFDLLHVVNWTEHQKINHPTESKLPPCQHHEAAAWACS
jgi:hypothetical protein